MTDEFLKMAEDYRCDDGYLLGKYDLINLCKKVQDMQREKDAKICDEQANEPECPERAQYCAEAIRNSKGE